MATSKSFSRFKISAHQTKTLVWWYKNRSQIDMDPPYQRRGRLWSNSDKAYLIDSIINGFDIPKLYVADFQYMDSELNQKRLPYAIIDGKQRFEAVFDFFENRVTLNKDFVWRKNPALKLGGLGLKDLKANYVEVADAFENESWDVMSVVADNEEDINELFVRLNRNKPLTGAEVRNAMIGPVPEVTRSIVKHTFFTDYIKFSTKRAGDINAATKVLLFEYQGRMTGTKKNDLDEFARDKDVEQKEIELSGRRVLENLDDMTQIFLPKDQLLSSAGLFPVFYWMVRELDSEQHVHVREFLLNFEERRQENRKMQKKEVGAEINSDLARFDTLNRSTNDIGSHLGRFQILMQEFHR